MKGKVFRVFCFSVLSFIVLLTGFLLINTTTVQAATTIDMNQTVDQVLPDNGSNDEQIVKKALLSANSKTKIESTMTLTQVQENKPQITIDQPLTDYTPLLKIACTLNGLTLTHQSSLSGSTAETKDNLPNLISTLLTNHPTYSPVEFLNLNQDNLSNYDLSALLDTANQFKFSTAHLILSLYQNNISDFSPWMDYKDSPGDNKPIYSLIAPSSPEAEAPVLTAQLTGTTVKMPFTTLRELTTPFTDPSSMGTATFHGGTIAFKVNNGPDFFDDPSNFDSTGRLISGKTVPATTFLEALANSPFDLQKIDTIDAQGDGYHEPIPANVLAFYQDALAASNSGGTVLPPADPNSLTITNVPANSTVLHLRVLVYPEPEDNPAITYIQNYTVKLHPASTSSAATTTPATDSSSKDTTPIVSQPDKAKPENKIVYVTKKIGLYKSPTFTSKARVCWYNQATRTNRPMFKVIGYARSKNGLLRYKVKDVTPNAKTYGQIGYITANDNFAGNAYYQTKTKKIKVLRGLNSYKTQALTGKQVHYRKNQVIRVKKLVTHNLTTRYQLPNGRYVSANKRLVIQVE